MIWGPSDLCLITAFIGTCIDSSGDHELYVPVWRSEDLS